MNKVVGQPKKGRFILSWSNVENDLMYRWGHGARCGANIFNTGLTIHHQSILNPNVLLPSVQEELERNGFDLKTLRIQIDKKERRENE